MCILLWHLLQLTGLALFVFVFLQTFYGTLTADMMLFVAQLVFLLAVESQLFQTMWMEYRHILDICKYWCSVMLW